MTKKCEVRHSKTWCVFLSGAGSQERGSDFGGAMPYGDRVSVVFSQTEVEKKEGGGGGGEEVQAHYHYSESLLLVIVFDQMLCLDFCLK